LFAWCVRLSRLLVGFRTHLKSMHFHSNSFAYLHLRNTLTYLLLVLYNSLFHDSDMTSAKVGRLATLAQLCSLTHLDTIHTHAALSRN